MDLRLVGDIGNCTFNIRLIRKNWVERVFYKSYLIWHFVFYIGLYCKNYSSDTFRGLMASYEQSFTRYRKFSVYLTLCYVSLSAIRPTTHATLAIGDHFSYNKDLYLNRPIAISKSHQFQELIHLKK